MFALLGVIPFEVLGSPEGYESEEGYNFGETKVIDAKPRIQWTGDDLRRVTLDVRFHASFTNPAVQLAALRASAATHLALPLVFGVGTVIGLFVIEKILMKAQVMTALGGLVECTVALSLKEFVPDSNALPFNPFPLLGLANAPSTATPAVSTPAATVAGPSLAQLEANSLVTIDMTATPEPATKAAVAQAPAAAPVATPAAVPLFAGATPILYVPQPSTGPVTLEPFDVPLATVVRAPSAFATTDPAAFAAPPPPLPQFFVPEFVPGAPKPLLFSLSVTPATFGPATVPFSVAGLGATDLASDAFAWDFGDGQTSTAAPPLSHDYTADGFYVASLVVTAPDGAQGSAMCSIDVGGLSG